MDTSQRFNRYYYRKPYYVPASLDDLRGPVSGTVFLDRYMYWQPGPQTLPLDEDMTPVVYQAVLAEGLEGDPERLLNKNLLIALWPRLMLPAKVVWLWESRFDELRGNLRSGMFDAVREKFEINN